MCVCMDVCLPACLSVSVCLCAASADAFTQKQHLIHDPYANHGAGRFPNICPFQITQFCWIWWEYGENMGQIYTWISTYIYIYISLEYLIPINMSLWLYIYNIYIYNMYVYATQCGNFQICQHMPAPWWEDLCETSHHGLWPPTLLDLIQFIFVPRGVRLLVPNKVEAPGGWACRH